MHEQQSKMDAEGTVTNTIAALYVQTDGGYFNIPGVEPWDEDRDARMYGGPWPIVAHPPCPRWGKMWFGRPSFVKETGIRKRKGDDQGCFKSALYDVRTFGGVIEHPWGNHAWKHFGLTKPPREGGWLNVWTGCVLQERILHKFGSR